MGKKKKRPLTKPELVFIEGVLDGLSYTDAYIKAYPKRVSKWKQKTIYNRASELAGKSEVKEELNRLDEMRRQEVRLSYRRSYEDNMKDLDKIIKTGIELGAQGDSKALQVVVNALKESNRMEGYYRELDIKESQVNKNKNSSSDGAVVVIANEEKMKEELKKLQEEEEKKEELKGDVK